MQADAIASARICDANNEREGLTLAFFRKRQDGTGNIRDAIQCRKMQADAIASARSCAADGRSEGLTFAFSRKRQDGAGNFWRCCSDVAGMWRE